MDMTRHGFPIEMYIGGLLWLKAQGLEPKVKPWIELITRELNGVPSTMYLSYILPQVVHATTASSIP